MPRRTLAGGVAVTTLASLLVVGAAFAEVGQLGGRGVEISGSLSPVPLPRSGPAPATLKFGFRSPGRDEAVPELAAISVSVGRRVSFDTTGIPSCSRHDVLESYEDPKPVCPRSLVGSGIVTSEITPPGGAPVLISGRMRALYSDGRGFRQILAQVTTGEPLPLVYVIPFELESADPPYGTRLVVRRPAMHRLPGFYIEGVRLKGVYSRISNLDLSLHRVVGQGKRRHSFISAECPLPPKVSRARLPLLRIDLAYEQYASASGEVESTCKAR